MIDKASLSKLFRLFATTIDGLDEHQIDQLLAGRGKLTFTLAGKARETASATPVDQATVLEKLNDCKDRDQARAILSVIYQVRSIAPAYSCSPRILA
jgi:hypothetical protein